jgi:glucose/arabinose dehydrogenase
MRAAAPLTLALLAVAGLSAGLALDPPQPVPDVVAGFVVQPLAPAPNVGFVTALAFGPGDADGPDLYAAQDSGQVVRFTLIWTPAGPVATGSANHATGFNVPLGLVFKGDVLYVADSHHGTESDRTDGRITRIDPDGTRRVVVDGLPNGRHNTNHLRFGPDGRLYVANGNPNDNGIDGGDADVFPYSGAILSVDAEQVSASPAVVHWRDATGTPIPAGLIATHARNADFASKVTVLASGFRNVFGIAFGPHGDAFTGMNGADAPSSQDPFYRIRPGTDYGFPFCYNVGAPGSVEVSTVANPLFPAHDCSQVKPADALLGWHVCATGLDLPSEGTWAFPGGFHDSVYVGECTPFFPETNALDNPTYNTGHKVARIVLDADGQPIAVEDFLTGLALPTDVLFGPDGAMYVADAVAVHRVASALGPLASR